MQDHLVNSELAASGGTKDAKKMGIVAVHRLGRRQTRHALGGSEQPKKHCDSAGFVVHRGLGDRLALVKGPKLGSRIAYAGDEYTAIGHGGQDDVPTLSSRHG